MISSKLFFIIGILFIFLIYLYSLHYSLDLNSTILQISDGREAHQISQSLSDHHSLIGNSSLLNIQNELVIWTSDFHISTVYDIKHLLKRYNVRLIDKSLSGHCHLTNTCQHDLHIINRENGIELSPCPNRLRTKFYEYYKYDPEFQSVDAFLCTHASSMCELYMPFGKPIIVVASTRFEIGRHQPKRWKNWIINLRKIAFREENTVAANNEYDREYIRYFTGLPTHKVKLLGSVCDYHGVSYNPIRSEILIGPSRGINTAIANDILRLTSRKSLFYDDKTLEIRLLRDLYPHYEYENLTNHPAVILVPYQVSFMLFFELYSMFIPMFVPTPDLLAQWHFQYGILSERTWDRVFGNPMNSSALPRHHDLQYASELDRHLNYDPNSEFSFNAILEWIRLSDFYRFQHVIQFSSLEHLEELISSPTLKNDLNQISSQMKLFYLQRSIEVHAGWVDVVTRIQQYREQNLLKVTMAPKSQLRSSWNGINFALKREYGVTLSDNCVDQSESGSSDS